MKAIKQDIFRAYDIRGIVNVDFDPQWVEHFGRACGTYFLQKGHTEAVIGHDCRHSSPEYQKRLIKGMISTGVDVIFLNMVPTPVFYYAIKRLGKKAGVMITASHNPPEFNGFKVWSGNSTIHTLEIQHIYDIMAQGKYIRGRGLASELDIIPTYIDELAAQSQLKNPLKVVVDGGNGSGGLVCAELMRRIGADVVELYCEPDGDFPNHHPDPTVEKYITDMQATVIKENADFGVGLDGDADRIGIVDEKGKIVYGDKLLAVYARRVLQENPGATVIGEVKCSHLLFQDIENHGGHAIMYKTGHSLIKAKMQETGAILAGEMSGHMFFADRFYGFDDAIYSAQRFAEIVDQDPEHPVSEYLSDWPVTFNTPEIRMDCPDRIKFDVVKTAVAYFKKNHSVIDVDGVRIIFADGWGLLRASNTQPVLVLRFEAESKERLEEIRLLVEQPLQKWIQEFQA